MASISRSDFVFRVCEDDIIYMCYPRGKTAVPDDTLLRADARTMKTPPFDTPGRKVYECISSEVLAAGGSRFYAHASTAALELFAAFAVRMFHLIAARTVDMLMPLHELCTLYTSTIRYLVQERQMIYTVIRGLLCCLLLSAEGPSQQCFVSLCMFYCWAFSLGSRNPLPWISPKRLHYKTYCSLSLCLLTSQPPTYLLPSKHQVSIVKFSKSFNHWRMGTVQHGHHFPLWSRTSYSPPGAPNGSPSPREAQTSPLARGTFSLPWSARSQTATVGPIRKLERIRSPITITPSTLSYRSPHSQLWIASGRCS